MKKIFKSLEGYQDDIIVKNNVYADETFVSIEDSKIDRKENNKKYRGLSHNKICIAILLDNENVVMKAIGFGKPNKTKYFNKISRHITSKSTLIHDGEAAHMFTIKQLNLNEKFYKAKLTTTRYNQEALKALEPINKMCGKLKFFLDKHRGFNKNDIQNWLNLYSFITNHKLKNPNSLLITIDLIERLTNIREKIKF